jgi:hypothetical protein
MQIIEAIDVEPNPNSVVLMKTIDGLSKPMRALVREYGFAIVRDMINDGYTDAFELAEILRVWRERRQEAWLSTDYVTKKSAERWMNAA